MNPAQASRVVIIAALLEAVFILARAQRGGESRETTVKSLWGIAVLTLGLSVAADFVPQIAGPFAILVLVALAARSRGDLGKVLGVAGTASTTAAASTQHPTRPGGESPAGPGR